MSITSLFRLFLCTLLMLLTQQFIYSMQQDDQVPQEEAFSPDTESIHFLDDLEDPFDFGDDDPFITEFLDTVGADSLTRQVDPGAIIRILLEVDAIDLLKEDFFLLTNPLNKRSPLDEPIFEPDRATFPGKWTVGAHLFARKMDRANFTRNSTNISSYLALTQPTLLEKLQNVADKVSDLFNDPLFNIDIKKIFSLFEKMTVQERQGGFMFHLMKEWRNTTFRLLTPIFYYERNFFLTDEEREAVEAEFGVLEEDEQKAFQKAHFISDRGGIGDTRIEIDWEAIRRPSFSLRAGGQITIPTAFTWTKRLKGSTFPKPSTFPIFDFDELFELAEKQTEENTQKAFTLISDFMLGALDRLAANLLDTKLGNDGHLGIGAYIRGKTKLSSFIKAPWAQRITFTNRISVEFLAPANEKRFFINKINEKEFEKRDFKDDDMAVENLTFLEQKFIEKFFLRAFDTKIRPGIIFRWTSKAHYQGRKWGWNLGSDLWVQDKETFRSIKASDTILNQINITKAKPPLARQHKIFGSIVYKFNRPRRTWFISLNGDGTYSNRGIGSSFALSLNVEASF